MRQAVNTASRIIDQWAPPDAVGDIQMINAFSIRARHQDLADYGERQQFPEEVIWVPPPPNGSATVIHVAIARTHEQPVNMGMVPFYGFKLVDGRAVLLLCSIQQIPTEKSQTIDTLIQQVRESTAHLEVPWPRMAIYGHENTTGARFAWDVALRPNSEHERDAPRDEFRPIDPPEAAE